MKHKQDQPTIFVGTRSVVWVVGAEIKQNATFASDTRPAGWKQRRSGTVYKGWGA